MTNRTLKRFWNQLPFFVWLVVLWMMLWGQFTWLAAITGVGVAAFVTTVFRLPPADLTGRVNVFWLAVFIVQFLWELVHGALQVAWQAIGPGTPSAAIVKAPLRVDDDLIMTHTAVAVSLVPGTTVVEADRGRRVLYLHAIGVRDDADLDRVRHNVLTWERRIVRAVGSRSELGVCRAKLPPYLERRESGEAAS
ncbi:Na+/H+ antiporter subunit E [Microbacterium halophytorum]|uniref:Na+/H+ antiporter subunit E n=1 Tax=Microbacterium halophytorum TaxID=2067568 RepID=UPI000CFD5E90|nr:Na+/H+ antiporter subunit E [Microbacterium halophytorum]